MEASFEEIPAGAKAAAQRLEWYFRLGQYIENNRADVVLRSYTGRPQVLLEFQKPTECLTAHLPQLRTYTRQMFGIPQSRHRERLE